MFVTHILLNTRYCIMELISHTLCGLSHLLSNLRDPVFYLGETIIPIVSQYKYLGVIISDHNCDADLKRQMRKFYTNANMLIGKFT